MLTRNQKYGLATTCTCSGVKRTLEKIEENDWMTQDEKAEARAFVQSVQKYFPAGGFIPEQVMRVINS